MSVTTIRKGLNLPLAGELESTDIVPGAACRHVALLPADSEGLKIRLLCREGDRVKIGSPLYIDRREENVVYTSPAAGEVIHINRGERRRVLSVVVRVDDDEERETFTSIDASSASRDQVKELLGRSGLWPALRQRPFGKVAMYSDTPHSLFITAADTQPLCAPVSKVLAGREEAFRTGATALSKLTDGKTFICTRAGDSSPAFDVPGTERHEFAGPHPAGNPGVHINRLDAVGPGKVVWYIGYQDVAAFGHLIQTGELSTERVLALVGPGVQKPQLVRTRLGAHTGELLTGNLKFDSSRVVSGSLLSGRIATPDTPEGFVGRYANQVSVVEESSPRELLGWMGPGGKKFSITNTYLGKFLNKTFSFNTDTNGSLRAIVPIGVYEKVMPMDIQPTFLIKALASNDIEYAEKLGALEVVEEDLALCEFVCPSKIAITDMLREMLTRIEKEG